MRRQSSYGGCRFFQTEMFFRAARPYPVQVVQAATDITQPRSFLILTPACGSRPNLAQVKKGADFHRDAVGFLKSLVSDRRAQTLVHPCKNKIRKRLASENFGASAVTYAPSWALNCWCVTPQSAASSEETIVKSESRKRYGLNRFSTRRNLAA